MIEAFDKLDAMYREQIAQLEAERDELAKTARDMIAAANKWEQAALSGFDPRTLTDDQLTQCLFEMRRRGAAVTYYDVAEIMTMTDGWDNQPSEGLVRAWFDAGDLEDAMSARVRQMVERLCDA